MSGFSDSDRIAIIHWAKRHDLIDKVYIYGSRARGDHGQESDIDIAIVMPWEEWPFWHNDFKENPDLKLSATIHLELYEKNGKQKRVGPGVKRDGILLYSRMREPKKVRR